MTIRLCESNSSEAIEDIDPNFFGGHSSRLRLLARIGFEGSGQRKVPEKNHTLTLKMIGCERKCHFFFSFFVAI